MAGASIEVADYAGWKSLTDTLKHFNYTSSHSSHYKDKMKQYDLISEALTFHLIFQLIRSNPELADIIFKVLRSNPENLENYVT